MRIEALKNAKKGFDRSVAVLVLSNWGWAFVINKTSRGVGCLAEGRRQRGLHESPESRVIAVIARDRKSKISTRRRGDAENWRGSA